MVSLKVLTYILRMEMLSHITFYSLFISKLSFEYFDLVLSKTRYSSHLSFLSCCLQFKVIPKGFKSSFKVAPYSYYDIAYSSA